MMPTTGYRPIGPGSGSIGSSGRTILKANTTYYVRTTGSDSNPGTLAAPWATLQHALFYIAQNLDIAGFTITINIGAGSFVGAGCAAMVGGGNLQINGAGSSSTTITGGPNDGVFNFGECLTVNIFPGGTVIGLNKVTLDTSAQAPFPPPAVGVYVPSNLVMLGDIIGRFSPLGDVVIPTSNGSIALSVIGSPLYVTQGNFKIVGSGTTPLYWINPIQGAIVVDQGTWTLSGPADTYTVAFIEVEDFGGYRNNNSSFTGAANGPQVLMRGASFVDLLGQGATFLPGSFASNIVPPDCSFDGIQGPFPAINTQTANYILAATDAFARVEMNLAGANTVTVPANATVAFLIGTKIQVTQIGAGATTIAGAVGVTVHNAGALSGQWGSATLYKRGTNEWVQTNA